MDKQEKHRSIQDYVEQQKAYLSNYSADGLLNDCRSPSQAGTGTPSRQLRSARSDGFGFDTPVLRPRVSKVASSQLTPQMKPSREQTQASKPDAPRKQAPAIIPDKAPPSEPSSSGDDSDQENRDPTPNKMGKRSRHKQKKASSFHRDTDDERAARLADRRERKRKKRAIVNSPLGHRDETASAMLSKCKKGKKASTPAALALMHGFSATNVTKNRLTAKKRATENSEDVSGDSFISSASSRPPPKKSRITNYDTSSRKQSKSKAAGTPISKAPEPSSHEYARSEVWDIELQSKCPSSLHEVSSEDARDSASVVLDLHGAEWFSCRGVAQGNTDEAGAPTSAPVLQGQLWWPPTEQSSVLPVSEPDGNAPHNMEASSLHPSHSASQVGRHLGSIQPSVPRLVASQFFTQPKPASAHTPTPDPPQISGTTGSIDVPGSPRIDMPYCQILDQCAKFTSMDAHTSRGIASPANSLLSVLQPMLEFRTPYDLAPPEILSMLNDVPPFSHPTQAPQDLLGRSYGHHHAWPLHAGTPSSPSFEGNVQEFCYTSQREERNSYRPSCLPYPSLYPGSGYSSAEDQRDICDTERPQYCDNDYEERTLRDEVAPVDSPRCSITFEVQHYDELDEGFLSEPGISTTKDKQDLYQYDYRLVDAEDNHVDSFIYDGKSADDHLEPSYLPAPDFLEGRALLLGLSEHKQRIHSSVESFGLLQAEMDVASRLRDHWRPQRL
ncbi:hypothetical protein BS17DRAFT_878418 [Gyrodon lividus]|nr:hypothetical protein BS17DRAFT_878418 [Gyrodon lividus]